MIPSQEFVEGVKKEMSDELLNTLKRVYRKTIECVETRKASITKTEADIATIEQIQNDVQTAIDNSTVTREFVEEKVKALSEVASEARFWAF